MLLTILMPEYLLGRALSDLLDAYKFRKFTKSQAKLRHKWTITHGYYANMGGFMFSLPPTPNPNPEHNGNENEVSDTTGEPHSPPGTSTHYTRNDYSAEEKGEHSSGSKHKTPLTGPIVINAKQLRFLLEEQILDTEPPISQNEILDKGQGDGFATISAVVQLIWLVSQLITRKVRHVPSSQLEILALAFAVCTIFTYILYYPKPQNIQVASNISYFECTCTHCKQKENEKKRREEPDHDRNGCDICKGKDYNSENCKKGVKNQDDGLCAKYSRLRANLEEDVSQSFFLNNFFPNDDPMELEAIIRNDKINANSNIYEIHPKTKVENQPEDQPENIAENQPQNEPQNEPTGYIWNLDAESIGFQIGAVILGLCHCLAWNFEFPTPTERILWRIASASITGIMPIYYFLWLLLCFWSIYLEPRYHRFRIPLTWLSFTIYTVARLYLLVAPFRELFFLPPEAFIATWSVSFPHFS